MNDKELDKILETLTKNSPKTISVVDILQAKQQLQSLLKQAELRGRYEEAKHTVLDIEHGYLKIDKAEMPEYGKELLDRLDDLKSQMEKEG